MLSYKWDNHNDPTPSPKAGEHCGRGDGKILRSKETVSSRYDRNAIIINSKQLCLQLWLSAQDRHKIEAVKILAEMAGMGWGRTQEPPPHCQLMVCGGGRVSFLLGCSGRFTRLQWVATYTSICSGQIEDSKLVQMENRSREDWRNTRPRTAQDKDPSRCSRTPQVWIRG